MDCSCAIDIYDGDCEPMSLFIAKIRKANKSHRCDECRKEIQKGEKYEYASYLIDSMFCVDKTCVDCVSARDQFYPRGGYYVGGLWEDISEEINSCGGEIPEACIAELTNKARSRLCDMINDFYAGD